MVYENIQDTAQVFENILNQPISIPDLEGDITLLQAAFNFKDEAPETSALNKILRSYLEFPESRETLINELDLLAGELKH